MAETTSRALRLLGLLQSRPVWTGPELAERLGVTVRSVRRDVQRLRDLGYPVRAAQGVGGGYQLGAGRALPPLLLDDQEAVAVAVSLRLAALGSVAGASEAALGALAKLDQVLPPRLRATVSAIQSSTDTLGAGRDVVDAEQLLVLAKACRDGVRVGFGYESRSGEASRRRIEPYRLVATGRRWYLMAWDLDREDWRTFRLDRMTSVEASTWRFTRREHPDPVAFVQRSVTTPYRHLALVRLHATYDEVAAKVSPTSATVVRESDTTCILEAGGDDLYGIAFHLAWLGHEMEVLEPPALRGALRELGDRMSRAGRVGDGRGRDA